MNLSPSSLSLRIAQPVPSRSRWTSTQGDAMTTQQVGEAAFKEWVEQREADLMTIRGERLALLKGLEKVLAEQADDGIVRVANRAVYQLALDSYEMLVIDLASFFRGMLQKGPGLNRLNNHLSQLTPGKEPKAASRPRAATADVYVGTVDDDAPWLAKYLHGHRRDVLHRLFPDCTSDKPSQEDVKKLKDRVYDLAERCITLRDSVHAHKYEHKNTDAVEVEEIERMKLADVEELLEHAQSIVNDLRLLGLRSTFGYPHSKADVETAKDLRDIIIHRSINRLCERLGIGDGSDDDPWFWQRRDAFYESDEWHRERSKMGSEE